MQPRLPLILQPYCWDCTSVPQVSGLCSFSIITTASIQGMALITIHFQHAMEVMFDEYFAENGF